MTVYVDSSVLLRIVLGERGALKEWRRIERAVASELIRVECLRTLDRARMRCGLDADEVAERRAEVLDQLRGFDIIPLASPVLERAADPFPTLLGTLDALHLASALTVRPDIPDLKLATHDRALGTAARACGIDVLGV
jgi:predicted nucleic acid-binding protein